MRVGQGPSVLDLLFTNEATMIDNLEVRAGLGKSDHAVLTFNFRCSWLCDTTRGARKHMYDKGDYTTLRRLVSEVDWNERLQDKTVEEAWKSLRSHLEESIATCILTRTGKMVNKSSKRPVAKVKMKNNMYRRLKNTRDQTDYQAYARARNQARTECRKAVRDYEKDIAKSITRRTSGDTYKPS